MAIRIALVDDRVDLLEVYGQALREDGYEVDGYSGGMELVHSIEDGGYDLILLDMVMPGMTGVDLLVRLKESMKSKMPPTVILTSMKSDMDRRYAMHNGAVDFWNKDEIELDVFVQKVRELVS